VRPGSGHGHAFFLHGLASSPRASKAGFLGERFRARGIDLHCPDLNEPDFETLTCTRMIRQVEAAMAALARGPVTLIGSSLGGFVAWHVAARQAEPEGEEGRAAHPVERLVLLAPAFDFGKSPLGGMDAAGLQRWRDTDRFEVFHHAENRPRILRYALYEDAQQYDSAASAARVPALVIQGTRDTVVDPEMVRSFAEGRAGMTALFVDDDHQLGSSFDLIWREAAAFVGIAA